MNKVLVLLCCLIYFPSQAQELLTVSPKEKIYRQADELLGKRNYGAASTAYERFLEDCKDEFSLKVEKARFNKAYCDIELFRPDGVKQMIDFVKKYPESEFLPQAYLKIAVNEFRKEDYSSTLDYLNRISPGMLEKSQREEFYFKRAYCNLQLGNEQDAVSDFYEIKNNNGEYKNASLFYYGYISFKNKKYQTALEAFSKIKDEFADVIPFYLVQVHFAQKDYEKTISQGEKIYESQGKEYQIALARILANSFFRTENYTQAINYYNKYFDGDIEAERNDKFEYGYCLYKENKYDEAVEYLQKVGGEDKLSQVAAFTIADCYLKTGNKKKARMALGTAAKMEYDARIAETALFNYAKINYELSYSPFNETINTFDQYITKYPDSGRNDEAYDYLVNVYMNTRNYSAALNSMDKIKYKTSKIKQAYQKVAFNRGVELLRDYHYEEAISYFNSSLKYKMYDKKISAYSLYWKAEALYRQGKYVEAIPLYNKFLETPGSSLTTNYNGAYYGLAYAYLKTKNYKKAVESFKLYEINDRDQSSVQLADARNRIADYYMYDRNYELSLTYYDKVISQGIRFADYALYKKSVLLGLMSDYKSQKQTVDKLLNEYPETEYYSELSYEIGNALMIQNKNSEAIRYYNNILNKETNSEYVPMAKLQLGLLNFNTKNFTQSEKYYKDVVENYKGTQYAQTASIGLKNVMIESSRVKEYFNYLDKQGMAQSAGQAERDSLLYISAERKYMDGDYDSAIKSFESYLKTKPEGLFVMNANYYLANSYISKGQEEKALSAYEKILDLPVNSYTLEAVSFAANKNYASKNYKKSLQQYGQYAEIASSSKQKLQANMGIVNSAYYLKEFSKVIDKAEELALNIKIDQKTKLDLLYMLSQAYKNRGDKINEKQTYIKLKAYSSNEKGAEAWYKYANMLYIEGKYKDAEKDINEFMDSNSPYHYWLAKSFMLLSDIFLNAKDEFQAKYTLKSIIENYQSKDDGIIQEAKKKLERIINKENAKEKQIKQNNKEKKPVIKMGDSKEYEKLFEKQEKKEDKVVEEGKKILEEMMKENAK